MGDRRELGAVGNPLFWFFFKRMYRKVVGLAGLRAGEVVLDFGCGHRHLRFFVPDGVRYIGYDSIDSRTDVKSLSGLNGVDVVFALHSFEHLLSEDLVKQLFLIKRTGANRLVVLFPSENFLNMVMRFLYGNDAINHFFHPSTPKQIAIDLFSVFGAPLRCSRVNLVYYAAVYDLNR